jgi:hypothetical protein
MGASRVVGMASDTDALQRRWQEATVVRSETGLGRRARGRARRRGGQGNQSVSVRAVTAARQLSVAKDSAGFQPWRILFPVPGPLALAGMRAGRWP